MLHAHATKLVRALGWEGRVLGAASLAIAAIAVTPAVQTAQTTAQVLDAEELRVLAAVVDAAYAPIGHGWVLVGARTTTFECHPPADTGLDVGGCSGMRVSAETPDERLATVRSQLSLVTSEMTTDLLLKSRVSALIAQSLATNVRHVLWAPGMKLDTAFTGNPAFAAYVSRVGFDSKREKAVVYLGTLNWTDQSKSMGQYLLLIKEDGAWRVTAGTSVWRK